MYSVEADRAKRLVVISGAGRVTKDELRAAAARTREVLKDFAPGFRLFTDFQWLEWMDPAGARYISDIMDAMVEKEVAEVIRVIPDPHKDIGLNILSLFHYGPQVRIVTHATLAEGLASIMAT